MRNQRHDNWSRRRFLGSVMLAGTGTLLGLRPKSVAAEPPPETTTLRLFQTSPACWAPQYVAEELLHAEGFTKVQYVKAKGMQHGMNLLKSGQLDLSLHFSARQMLGADTGDRSVILAGLHAGCFTLLGSERINSVRDLKGKTVWAGPFKMAGPHLFFSSIMAYVGLDPRKDINYAWGSPAEAMRLFTEGEIDAFMSFAPGPEELRAKKIGRVLVDTNVDRPWSQYFCCMVVGNREFIRRNPVATKRALRALLKANDICAREPELAARTLVERKVRKASEYNYIVQAMKEIPYGKWREYNPEDTIRFYTLRLREVGMIKSSPQEIISQNTDWRFLRELKKELNLKW